MVNTILQAMEYLRRGDLAAAHRIAQQDDTMRGAWLHGLVHLAEGDVGNARYWFSRAGRPLPARADLAAELERLAEEASGHDP